MEPETKTPATEATTPAQPAAASSAATLNPEQPPQEQTVPYSRFKEINDKLKAIEDDNAKKAKEQQAENEKKLAAEQEWQKLADSRKAKVDELTPKAELADELSTLVLEQYEAELKEWPEAVRKMAPADDADVRVKLDWMKRARPLAQELMADKTPTPGNGRRPTPSGAANTSKAADKELADWRQNAARRYR